jgi:hypothetical protein
LACSRPPTQAGVESDERFRGTIEEVQDLRPIDGALSIVVDGKRVTIGGGSDAGHSAFGSTEGFELTNSASNVGKHVEVFARKYGARVYGISAGPPYYVKVVP